MGGKSRRNRLIAPKNWALEKGGNSMAEREPDSLRRGFQRNIFFAVKNAIPHQGFQFCPQLHTDTLQQND
jgi:hypothetical protein